MAVVLSKNYLVIDLHRASIHTYMLPNPGDDIHRFVELCTESYPIFRASYLTATPPHTCPTKSGCMAGSGLIPHTLLEDILHVHHTDTPPDVQRDTKVKNFINYYIYIIPIYIQIVKSSYYTYCILPLFYCFRKCTSIAGSSSIIFLLMCQMLYTYAKYKLLS